MSERLLPRAHYAQHHYATAQPNRRVSQDGFVELDESSHEKRPDNTGFFGGHREPVRGRKWDHAREGDPVIMQSGVLQKSSPWRSYIKSSQYGPPISADSQLADSQQVDEDFLREQTPGYEKPWRGDVEDGDDPENLAGLLRNKKRRRTFMKRLQVSILGSLSSNLTHYLLEQITHAPTCATGIPTDCSHNLNCCSRSVGFCSPFV